MEDNIIRASEDMYLTQNRELDDAERIYATEVALGNGDSADFWKEVNASEYEDWQARMEERMRLEMEAAMNIEPPEV